jgi:hypothetical protein
MPRLRAAGAMVLLAAAVTVCVATVTSPALAATNQFKGVNWADPRDNYTDDPVVPS